MEDSQHEQIHLLQIRMEEISRTELKLCKIIIKYAPLVIAIGYFIMSCAFCFGIMFPIISSLCYLTIIPFISLFAISKLLKFCSWHRLPLWYSISIDLLNAIFYYFNLPIVGKPMLAIYLTITILFITIGMILKEKNNVKNRTSENGTSEYNRQYQLR